MYLLKIKKMLLALSLAALPISVNAAGLGQLNVASGIGEPLKAEVALLSLSASEKASLKARIAPESTYSAQGLVRPSSHNGINIRIAKSAGGKNVLKLSSNRPIAEPFLDMLVELEWNTGRIVKQYTVLLDPPGYQNEIETSQVQAPTIKAVNNKLVKNTAPIKKSSAVKSKVKVAPPTVTNKSNNADEGDYLTRRGDTLSKIANRMRPRGVSLDQMLIGLYEANPEAFVGKNINRLKVGKILQPPTEEALNAISRKKATKEVKVQAANWNQYRNKLAGIVAESTPEVSEVETQSSSGKIKPSAEDKSMPADTGPKDVVKLSSGDASASEIDMQAKITALQEEVSAREKGLQDALERTSALEKQIEDMQKLLTLKSNAMLEAQQQSSEAAPVVNEGEETTINEPTTVEPIVEASAQQPTEAVVEEPIAAAEPAVVEPKPAVESKPVVETKPAAELSAKLPSFVSGLLDNISGMFRNFDTTLLGTGAGAIALLTAGWFYLRNKRRKSLADFEQGIMTSGGLKANTVFGNTSGASVDTGDTSFLTDFSQTTSGGMIDTNDVDPIAEAEVYMAYGRDAQAEEILKDAISKEPKRYELHLKLLEMYAASKDMSAFETVSGELYTTLGADDPTWAKVAEIGIKLEPNNPLYQAKAGVGEAAGAEGEKLDASDFSESPLAAEADLDFSLNDNLQTDDASSEVSNETSAVIEDGDVNTVDLDVDDSVLDLPNVSEIVGKKDDALEFDLNALNDLKAEGEDVVASAAESFANTMPSLDFPITENAAVADEDELSVPEAEQDGSATFPELEVPSDLSLDMPQETPTLSSDKGEEASVELEAVADEDFGFDVDTLAEDTVTLDASENIQEQSGAADEPNVLDMTDISLEINDDVDQAISEATLDTEPEAASEDPDSEEVETKLELVAAYVDMEDKEGAKELLDEVLKEGGASQRKRAEDILASLG